MEPSRRRAILILALVNLGIAGAAYAISQEGGGSGLPGSALVTATGPQDESILRVRVDFAQEQANVLAVLHVAAQHQGVTVETAEFLGLGRMVVSIGGISNEGACGWIYAVDGVHGDREARRFPVTDSDHVQWSWSCSDPDFKET